MEFKQRGGLVFSFSYLDEGRHYHPVQVFLSNEVIENFVEQEQEIIVLYSAYGGLYTAERAVVTGYNIEYYEKRQAGGQWVFGNRSAQLYLGYEKVVVGPKGRHVFSRKTLREMFPDFPQVLEAPGRAANPKLYQNHPDAVFRGYVSEVLEAALFACPPKAASTGMSLRGDNR